MIDAVKNSRFILLIERQLDAIKNSRLALFIERHFLRLEFWGTVFVTVVLVVWGYKFDGNHVVRQVLEGDRSTIYGTLASIFASLFGFTLAAISFVIGLSNRSRLYHLRTSEQYKTLRKAFMSAIWWSGFAAIASLVGLIVDRGTFPILTLVYLVTFSTVLVSFRVANCVLLLGLIVDVITQPSRAQSGESR